MSIIIKGMEMPKNCGDCWFEYAYEFCESKYEDCPLIELQPHGDLIDRDAAYEQFLNLMDVQGAINPCQLGAILVDAPTIIPAEEGE